MAPVLIIFLLVLAVLWLIAIFNSLVQLRESAKNSWAQVDVQLKRRHDLIPNLVETAKGYLAHEKGTLEKVIQARQQAVDARGLENKQQAENLLSGALRSLFAVVENYPNLKADKQMLQLHEELVNTENKITFARQYYNDEVNRFNVMVQSFPSNMVAQAGGFTKFDFFEIKDISETETPDVKF